ncbi:MAG: serine/threonine protein kinase [Symplocastrum torsivum CPER-KK1]|uniref:non-specific serine/threonine protein kinase n=1 Tax=Symplocastrum torsivum CPER-KK1 TaxID=450513 RepID=A0A951PQ30_9CYAN|nr:serine/threonine protein kinase [Symplocastrum torsivum CPER-KK1]
MHEHSTCDPQCDSSSFLSRIEWHCVPDVIVHQSVAEAVHCINPDCPRPYPQPWGNKFCNGCGAALRLNDRYVPLQRLGSGGFATIYTVWDLHKKSERVLKVLVETSPKALQLFEQEAAVLARLKHPGVPKVEVDSYFLVTLLSPKERLLPCLVMEKIHGQTLQDVLDKHPQGCSEESVRDWLYQTVEILRELHNSGIIHRDLKPSNLMLRERTGQLVAIDFGGAKQIGLMPLGSQAVSTRLISPGYSPPEQITGEAVGPAADFYALGRTMIQLLTGQELGNLQDPVTGEFRWRHCAAVSPALADLLDQMVRIDPQQRPATADEIQRRLAMTPVLKPKSPSATPLPEAIAIAVDTTLEVIEGAIASIGEGVLGIVGFVFRVITGTVLACVDTTWEMVLGGVGATVGAAVGFTLINWTPLGDRFADWLSLQLPQFLPNIQVTAWQELLLFAIAGLGTAAGLTLAGGFGQQRRPIVAGLMGILGYGIGWLIWQAAVPFAPVERLLGLITAVAVAPLVLGLGLPSHYLVHAIVAAAGTGTVLGGLVWLRFLPADFLVNLFSHADASLANLINSLAFFCLWAALLGFWLGVSYYLLVPVLRWLGWR